MDKEVLVEVGRHGGMDLEVYVEAGTQDGMAVTRLTPR